ncbi:type VI secretion system baseplate subunit TssG [Klebsiella pneumoniae subsp. pneumoniae]|nr:type VI secretion system baseplate subunit TssG [Klebsiella pneumoniae subsp. pneumoniae]
MTLRNGGKARRGHRGFPRYLFNYRLIAQYYRIWRKYSYPATFRAGGTDNISQYLPGLAGPGARRCARRCRSAAVAISWRCWPGDDAAGESPGRHGGAGGALAPRDGRQYHCDPCRIPCRSR